MMERNRSNPKISILEFYYFEVIENQVGKM